MEILQYIAELVQSQREVGITGLGTIYKKKSPGRYDTATQSFLPPSYTVAFKTALTGQELLVTRIASANNISEEQAQEAIYSFVAEIRQQLTDQGRADFAPIGTLTLINGEIAITAQENFSAGYDFFGLPKFESEALNEPEPIIQVEEVNNTPESNEPIPDPTDEPIIELEQEAAREQESFTTPEAEQEFIPTKTEEFIPQVEEEIILDNLMEEENPGKETYEPQLIEVPIPPAESSIKYTIQEQPAVKSDALFLKVFLTLLGLVIIGAIAYLLYPRTAEQKAEPAAKLVDSTEIKRDSLTNLARSKAVSDSIAREDSTSKEKPAADTAVATPVATVPTTAATKTAIAPAKRAVSDVATTYEIIGASVLNEKEANWFITQMKRNGITAKIVRDIPGKRLKMSIATLQDEQSAKAERDRLEKKLAIKGIYIYRNKKG
jgi:nucleoid DNA-binding protein